MFNLTRVAVIAQVNLIPPAVNIFIDLSGGTGVQLSDVLAMTDLKFQLSVSATGLLVGVKVNFHLDTEQEFPVGQDVILVSN